MEQIENVYSQSIVSEINIKQGQVLTLKEQGDKFLLNSFTQKEIWDKF